VDPSNPSKAEIESLEALFAQLGGSGDDLEGPQSEEELNGLLETMMSQLMSKEVLYEPLKELHEKVGTHVVYHVCPPLKRTRP